MAKPVWDREEIFAAVRRRKKTLTGIAREQGLYDSACREALSRGNTRGEYALSKELGIPLEELFPKKYGRENRARANHNGRGDKRQKRAGTPDKGRASA